MSGTAVAQVNVDSLTRARKHIIDSTRAAQKHQLDSVRAVRQHQMDSARAVREHRADSLAAIRKYRESKRYKDSVVKARESRIDSIKAVRTAFFDSVRAERKRVTDSTIASRKAFTDSIRTIQKRRTDSLAAIRKYRESKRYKDSVVVVRTQRLDSIKAVRKAFSDSMMAARKAINDSIAAERKVRMDSITAVRTQFLDSLKAVRKVRADSLAKLREKKEKAQKDRLKNREEKMQLALELKIKKKREKWSNEKLLKKRWSVPRQVVQNTFTRYNYYFNTDNKMDEALDNMQRMRKENYDSLLALFPFDPDRDSSALASDMDSIIQKASVGIQIHDPRTKWGDDLYLLMGQAYYYKGDYENASTTFRYIVSLQEKRKKKSKNSNQPRTSSKSKAAPTVMQQEKTGALDFIKHRSVHNESLLWLARTYTESHQEGNAESVLDLLETDPNMPESLKGRLALERAYVNLSQGDLKNASDQLAIVANDKQLPDWVRQRAAYMNGQILQDRGQYVASAASFDQVVDLHPKIDMDFYARKNRAYSMMMGGSDQEEAVASLKDVLKDGKYVPYYEQVYYVMGRLSAGTGKNEEAIEYLEKGISAPRATRPQKALSFAALGNVHYGMRNYVPAKSAYDSAAILGTSIAGDSLISLAIRRSGVLGEITGPEYTIRMQDSLLHLASLSEREQRSEVRRYIRYLQDRRSDSIFRAENAGMNAAAQGQNAQPGNNMGGNSYANWYFANPVLMQQGANEFKMKWSSRPNADNWRRAAAVSYSNSTAQQAAEETVTDDGLVLDENGIPTEESLLAFIPSTTEQKDASLKNIRRAYVDMANGYIKQLEDYNEAIRTLDTLDTRFPAHEHKAEVLYLRYLVALRLNKLNEAQGYASQLQQQYGSSQWAQMVRPTEDSPGMNSGGDVAAFYDETYGLMMQHQYTQVLQRSREGQKQYSNDAYRKRFRIIEAIALVGTNDYLAADTLITDFITKYPVDSLRPWADMVLSYIKKYKLENPQAVAAALQSNAAVSNPNAGAAAGSAPVPGQDAASQPAGTVIPPPLPGASGDISVQEVPANYSYDAGEPHYVMFVFPGMEQRAMGVKAALADFNTFKFGSLGLASEVEMLNPQQGLIITRTFENMGKAKIYMNTLRSTAQVFREYKASEYQLIMISGKNYRKLAKDKDLAAYMNFYRGKYK